MEPIGFITVCHGSAAAQGAEGSRELTTGSPLYENDVVTTAKGGSLEIEFIDDARLALGEGSEVILDKYVYSDDMGDAVIKMVEGTFRTTTGALVDVNPEGFILDTPLSTVGIRGTEIGSHVPGGGQPEQHFLLEFDGKPVVITASVGGPPAILTSSGTLTSVSRTGVSPIQPMSQSQMDFFDQFRSSNLQSEPPQRQSYPENGDTDGDHEGGDGGNDERGAAGEAGNAGENSGTGGEEVQITLFGSDHPAELQEGGGQLFGLNPLPELDLTPEPAGQPTTPPSLPQVSELSPQEEEQYETTVEQQLEENHTYNLPDFPGFDPDSDGTGIDTSGFTVQTLTNSDDYWETNTQDHTIFVFMDGDDDLAGNSDNYSMFFGGSGNDTLTVSGNNCVSVGGTGNDTLIATNGNALVGGSDSDKFAIGGENLTYNNGYILDFNSSEGDKLVFTDVVSEFNQYGSNGSSLHSVKFVRIDTFGEYDPSSGQSSTDNNGLHRFIYTKLDTEGTKWGLYYDSDGTAIGSCEGDLVFTFDGDVNLTADDIIFDAIT